jgi:hypothetical protein
MNQPTEGIWTAKSGWGGDAHAWVIEGNEFYDDGSLRSNFTVAVVDTRRNDKANAHLIAASKELLAACRRFCNLYATGAIEQTDATRDVYVLAFGAVEKATNDHEIGDSSPHTRKD